MASLISSCYSSDEIDVGAGTENYLQVSRE